MKTVEFLSHLRSLGVDLSLVDGRLRCDAPKGVLSKELRDELGRRKDEILAFIQETILSTSQAPPPIPPVPRDGELPVSLGQQRLWLLEQFTTDQPAYKRSGQSQPADGSPSAAGSDLLGGLRVCALLQRSAGRPPARGVRRPRLIRRKFEIDVPLALMFEQTTLGELANSVDGYLLEKVETMSEEEVTHFLVALSETNRSTKG